MAPAVARRYIPVLFIQDGAFWRAQALEFDLSAQGSSLEKAKRAFECAFIGQVLLDRRMNRKPFSSLPPAPKTFWDQFFEIVSQRPTTVMTEPIETDPVPGETPPAFMVQAYADQNQNRNLEF